MPKNNTAQKTPQKKTARPSGGVAKRSQVTGRQLGRAAIRALEKNEQCIVDYLTKIHDAKTCDDLLNIEDVDAFVLGRVTRAEGAGWFTVQCRDGTEAKVHVSGTISFHGRAGTKTDRENCIIQNDLVVISGGRASAKLDGAATADIRKVFDKRGLPYPKGFFSRGATGADDKDDDLFDYGGEEESGGAAAAAAADEDEDEDEDEDKIDVDTI
jgi:hypothetical protein